MTFEVKIELIGAKRRQNSTCTTDMNLSALVRHFRIIFRRMEGEFIFLQGEDYRLWIIGPRRGHFGSFSGVRSLQISVLRFVIVS